MALINQVQAICQRLAPFGWSELFERHGLNILENNLMSELSKNLNVDRTISGFEDFSPSGVCAIEPCKPALSLLYHGLASPAVLESRPGVEIKEFPTEVEIETVLNYVYAISSRSLGDLYLFKKNNAKLAIVTFAYEYRSGSYTTRQNHANLIFSRTGICRVGTLPSVYDPKKRRHISFSQNEVSGINVIPVRYGAFIAVLCLGDENTSIPLNFQIGDETREFWIPLHKVFEGDECLVDITVDLQIESYHVNEKLRNISAEYPNVGWEDLDTSQPPFVRTDGLCETIPLDQSGAVLIEPISDASLVKQVYLKDEPLTILAPANNAGGMTHLRHEIATDGSFNDLNKSPDLKKQLESGGHRAIQYQDNTADGYVKLSSLNIPLDSYSAYSIIAPPDFFPSVSQTGLTEWTAAAPSGLPEPVSGRLEYIWQGRPTPLCDIRYAANVKLPGYVFDKNDLSVFALVSQNWSAEESLMAAISFSGPSVLPDQAAGKFNPGWEVGYDRDQDGKFNFICGYRLGNPFTEDVRICAALGSFWPSVSPDTTRTFEPRNFQTHVPLLDHEIGIDGEQSTPWDGVQGPKVVEISIKGTPTWLVEYSSYDYTDYTSNALGNKILVSQTGGVSPSQYKERILSLWAIYRAIGCGGVTVEDEVRQKEWAILSFDILPRTNPVVEQAQQEAEFLLSGNIYYVHIYKHGPVSTPDDFTKRHVVINEERLFITGDNGVLIKNTAGEWSVAESV